MLILSRKVDQAVLIGLGITVRVLKVERDRVSLGFEAPADVAIWREEMAAEVYEEATQPVELREEKGKE